MHACHWLARQQTQSGHTVAHTQGHTRPQSTAQKSSFIERRFFSKAKFKNWLGSPNKRKAVNMQLILVLKGFAE